MWRSALLGVVIAGVLAGCSCGGSEAGSGGPTTGGAVRAWRNPFRGVPGREAVVTGLVEGR